MADKIESKKSKVPLTRFFKRQKAVAKAVTVKPPRPPPPSNVPPTRPPRRPKAVPKAVTVKPPRPPPPSNYNLLSVPISVAVHPPRSTSANQSLLRPPPPSNFDLLSMPIPTPTISWPSFETKGKHIPWGMTPIAEVTNGKYNEFEDYEQLVCQKDIPIAQISPTLLEPSSSSSFESPNQGQSEVLRFIFTADPHVEINYQDVLDHTRSLNIPDPDVAPDFDLPENLNFDDFWEDEVTIL